MKVLFFLTVLTSLFAWAHGEKKLGPHSGFIRMPGSFHTELVETPQAFLVYLLDMDWKNPTIENSSVEARLVTQDGPLALSCSRAKDHFACAKPAAPLKQVILKASRLGQQGIEAVYAYPLSLGK